MIENQLQPDLRGMQSYMQPLFQQKDVTILNENCLDTMAKMPDNFVDLVVTSPPYDNLREYNGYVFDFEPIAKELYRVIKPGGVLVWVVGDATINGSETGTSYEQALYFKKYCGFNIYDTMIYEIAGTGAKGSNLAYWQSFEFMFVFSKWKPSAVNRIADIKNIGAGKTRAIRPKSQKIGSIKDTNSIAPEYSVRPNVWRYAVGCNDVTDHPAPFPEKLVRDHIYTWSNEGNLVYDPFGGSGTTMKMAHLQKPKVSCPKFHRNTVKWLKTEFCHTLRKSDFFRLPLTLRAISRAGLTAMSIAVRECVTGSFSHRKPPLPGLTYSGSYWLVPLKSNKY